MKSKTYTPPYPQVDTLPLIAMKGNVRWEILITDPQEFDTLSRIMPDTRVLENGNGVVTLTTLTVGEE